MSEKRSMSSKELKNYFKKAQKGKWAVGQFNVSNLETLRGIFQAAGKSKSPVIIGTSEGESKFLGLREIRALVSLFEEETGVPAILNLDHAKSFDYIKKVIQAGYDSVHFDGSHLPLSQNISLTRKIVKYAVRFRVLVEGEVGVIGGDLTDPAEAQKFVEETKADTLAVNVGTIHGIRKSGKNPPINLRRLEEIKEKVGKMPLVLHGGSGTSNEDIKKAIKIGIVKININTELRNAFTGSLRKALKKNAGETTPYKYLPGTVEAVQKVVEEKIKLFGSANKI